MLARNQASEHKQQSGIHHVRIWFKTFVPDDIADVQPVPAGPHVGKSMFRSPGPIEAWFLTDQRGFSADPEASARMHSEIELDLLDFHIVREFHKCDPTIQVDHKTGLEDCCETADASEMSFTDFQFSREAKQISMHLHGSAKNECLKLGPVKLSPNLDYAMDMILKIDDSGNEVALTVNGQIEPYPAFEMYVTLNGGSVVTVFQEPVQPGKTPAILIGPPQRALHKSVITSC
jgi:hypothetical protein